MQGTSLDDEAVTQLLTSFALDHDAGRNPDPNAYLQRCARAECRDTLSAMLDDYLSISRQTPGYEGRFDQVGPYKVEGELGCGGMARVLEVWDMDLNRSLAMKVSTTSRVNADGSVPPGQERNVARFLQEAQITSQLRHPGVVPVHRVGIDSKGHLYFTMRLIEEETLEDVLKKHHDGVETWSMTRAVGVLLRVCETVAFAHSQEVIHRDLKPKNIMVGRFGEAYVLDWGLAKSLDPDASASIGNLLRAIPAGSGPVSQWFEPGAGQPTSSFTAEGAVAGTPAYMPPEQARDEETHVGKQADVYAVGAILYELLTGQAPYSYSTAEGEPPTSNEVVQRVLNGDLRPVGSLAPESPGELQAICEKAMARQPEERYGSMTELRNDLEAFLDGRVVRAYAHGPLAELKKWMVRNKRTAVGGALVTLLLGVVFAERFVAQRRELRERDKTVLVGLQQEVEDLLPIHPELVPRIEGWLSTLDAVKERRADWIGTSPAAGEGDSRRRLDELMETAGFLGQRLELARSISDRSLQNEEAVRAWDEALSALEGREEFADVRLEPRMGLLPLGIDPQSSLLELVDLQTGDAPQRDPVTGRLRITEGTGLVFVLLPGGRLPRGASPDEELGPEGEPTRWIPPFLISKYEMTQGQWLRMTGDNPSQFAPGSSLILQDQGIKRVSDLTHPVELVSWDDCNAYLTRLGFDLPSEVQWEYAARAGATTPWWSGSERDSLRGVANLADRSARIAKMPTTDFEDWVDLDDGHAWHAPVGSFLPNAFGLHDVHGNVFEWCKDVWALRAEGVVSVVGPKNHVLRGGAWNNKASYLEASYRMGGPASTRRASVGVRPVLNLSAPSG